MTPDFSELAGRVVLVTGSSTGIGAAVARGFAACGARVVVHGSANLAAAEAVAAGIAVDGGQAIVERADLSRTGAAAALVGRVVERLGRLDVLINNAGALFERRRFGDDDDAHEQALMALNVSSLIEASRAAGKVFRAQGSGCIVNTTSVAARNGGGPGTVIYAATKGAVSTFTRGLAREWAAEGLRVNAVAPGIIVTPLHDRATPPETLEALRRTIPLQRLGTPEECVGAYLFLACESLSGYITGQVIEVNGGQLTP